MKLRSIALAGLLSAGLLMTSGCTEDLIEDILKVNVIYTLNARGEQVTFTVTGDTDTPVQDQEYAPHLLTGHSDYAVSYTPGAPVPISFPYGSVYMYAAANCSLAANGYLQHEVNANKVNFVNLSEVNLPGSSSLIVITQADGVTTHTVAEDIGLCSVNGASSLDGVVFENDMTISLDGGTTTAYTVTGMDPDLIALGDRLKIDVVLFDGNMTVVPMVGYDDLLAIGVGAL